MRNYAMTNLSQSKPTNPTLTTLQWTSLENKKWILVGAQQAGASSKRMAEMANLPRGTVRRILSNFSRTGIPSASSNPRPSQVKDMPIIEYDSDGNITSYEDNRARTKPRAKDLIAYVMAQKALDMEAKKKPSAKVHTNRVAIASSSHDKPSALAPSHRFVLMTPPQESYTMQQQEDTITTMIAPLGKSERRLSFPPSPPLHPTAPLDTSISEHSLPQPYSDPHSHERWTRKDDQILLKHVFSSVHDADWHLIEEKLQGRHRASMCRERWIKLQAAMLDGLSEHQ
ncbi:hypothetical protein BGW37DRAFT_445379 [Umbelopsis sp. PMI_123]|nr:hypothetical protein BGW37DRAFT_445379 [Umbelopsis sp. PMI_123]